MRSSTPSAVRGRGLTALLAVVAAWLAAGSVAVAAPDGEDADYARHGRGWNGLRELLELAAEAGVQVNAPARIDLGTLGARDGLLLIYPQAPPPRADLAAFMYEGGRLALADDFGEGVALLEGFQIERTEPPVAGEVRRLRGNRNVLIATPRVRHPLSLDVHALVTNHAQALRHAALDAIFSLDDDERGAVVLAGAVGKGRLVAIGDSSVLINNMLEFSGNRAFARNLLRYLAQDGQLWIAAPATELAGTYGQSRASDPLEGLRAALARLSRVRLPESAIRASTAVIALLLLFGAASGLPRRTSLLRAVALPAPEMLAGFAGRIRFFASPGRDLLVPLLAYKVELEHAIAAALGLNAPIELLQVEARMRASRHPEALVLAVRALLLELASHALPSPRPVPARKFHELVAEGDRILVALRRARDEER